MTIVSITVVRTAVAATALLAASQASAVSPGDTVTCAEVGPASFVCSSATAVVGPGPEFVLGFPDNAYFTVDFSAGLVRLQGLQDGTLFGTILEFTNLTSPFTSASFRPSAWDGYSFAEDVTLSGGLLTINLVDTAFNASSFIEIGLASGVVPEPASWALLIAGFGLVGGALRSRRRRAYARPAVGLPPSPPPHLLRARQSRPGAASGRACGRSCILGPRGRRQGDPPGRPAGRC